MSAITQINHQSPLPDLIEEGILKQIHRSSAMKAHLHYPRAILTLANALKMCIENNKPTLASRVCSELASLHLLEGTMDKVRAFFIQSYDFSQGLIDPHALRVEQNETAISTSHSLGTDSLGECMALALFHPDTKTIGLAHIDIRTTQASIAAFIERMPEGKKFATVIGGSIQNENMVRQSLANLNKIKTALDHYKDLAVTTTVMKDPHPTAFTLTLDGTIHPDRVPMGHAQQRFARNGLASFSNQERDLRIAYRQEGGEMRELPIQISLDIRKEISPYLKMNEEEITKCHARPEITSRLILAEEIIALTDQIKNENL